MERTKYNGKRSDIENLVLTSSMNFDKKKDFLASSRKPNYHGFERSDEQRSWLADKVAFCKRRNKLLDEIRLARRKAEILSKYY